MSYTEYSFRKKKWNDVGASRGVKVKVKCTLVQALRLCTGRTAHRGNRGISLLFLDHGNRKGCGVSVTPRPHFTPGKTRYPLYRRLGGPQGRSGQARKNSPPPEFDPQTVQSLAGPLAGGVVVENITHKEDAPCSEVNRMSKAYFCLR